MAESDIQMIVNLVGCSREKAEETLHEKGDLDSALDFLIEIPKPKFQLPARPKKELDPIQQHLAEMRSVLERMERSISSGRHGYAGQVERIDHREETVPQNNCSQKCPQASQE